MSKSYVPVRQDPRKMRYIEWLTTPPDERTPSNEVELAAELDVYPKTLYNWRHDREFKDVWSDEADIVLGGEDRRQAVINSLFEVATDTHHPRHVTAAKTFLDYTKEMRPERGPGGGDPTAGKALSMLTDEELNELIARGATEAMGVQVGEDTE